MTKLFKFSKSHLVASVVAGTVLVTAPIATSYAFESEGFFGSGMHKHVHKRMKKMAKHLDLTDSQVEQIKAIRAQNKEQMVSLRSELKTFKDQVKTLKDSPVFDEQAFNATYLQYQDTFAQLALQKARSRHAMYQVLTTEQQAKFDTMMEQRKAKLEAKRAKHATHREHS